MNSGYTPLAWFYNKYWTYEAPDLFEKILNRLLLPSVPKKGRILELCCGTGQICERLSQRLFEVVGLDNSPEMLKFAKVNAPSASFILGDARDFKVNKPFDAVTSLFDSINHILAEDELLKTFQCVRGALNEGGVFLFDVNDSKSFNKNWENGFSMVEDNDICILKPSFDSNSGIAVYNITMMERVGETWRRMDTIVHERYYSDEVIVRSLTKAGFTTIQLLDGWTDLRVKAFANRRFILAS
ncbi:MAG: class I SAM-dependent methyltransferase [Deferribacteraceae bacterium]|jgi:SAM-dependent methyltransferase|nr:class I SAM-dependent methyltransferase [Deferribacteraceae bacterium]